MKRIAPALILALTFLLIGLLASSPAFAQASGTRSMSEEGRFSIAMGMGFTAAPDSPETFLLDFEGDYRLAQGFSLGGQIQIGLEDDYTLVSPAGYLRYTFDLDAVRPYAMAGFGFTYVDLDLPAGSPIDDDDVGFMLNFGIGTDVVLTDRISLTSKMLFNFMPDDIFGEDFYYSWEILGVRFRF